VKEGASQASQGFALSMKTDNSIIVTTCQTGQDYLADDVQADSRYFSWEGLPETRSELAIPLHFGQEILGVLDIQSDHVAAFDRDDRTVLQTLANQIGIAIRNARLYSQLEQANERLEEASLTDPLTGMRNRRYLLKFIHADIAKVHRDYTDKRLGRFDPLRLNSDIAFLLLDLDHFKSVNDTYGHEAGDRVLKQMREILEKFCRKTDILIRWGGEEFLIEGRHSNRRYIQTIAERIQKAVQEHPFDIGGNRTVHLTCSLGFASYPFLPSHPDSLTWEQVIGLADRGLYAAKMSGRNAYVGIVSTETTSHEKLFQHLQENMTDLINSGELTVVTSLSDTENLVFHE
jgi:diguanylate cyclase (GGDEF)-like protein